MYRPIQFRLWQLLAFVAVCGVVVWFGSKVIAQLPGTIDQLPASEKQFVQQMRQSDISIVDSFT